MVSNNKQAGFVEMVLVIVAFLVLVGVGVYWFMNQSQADKKLSFPNFSESQNATSSPAAGSDASLDMEIEAIEIEDPASDLGDIDKDLNSL